MLSTKIFRLPSPYSNRRDVNQIFENKEHLESNDFSAETSAQIEPKEKVLSSEKNRHFDINNVQIWDNDDRKMQELMDRPEELTAKYFDGEISSQWLENTRRDKVMPIREEKSSVQTIATSSTILASNVVFETISPITNTKSSSESRSLFDTKRPSALTVTDMEGIKTAEKKFALQIKKGWRWVSKGSIYNNGPSGSVKSYSQSYRVAETNAPDIPSLLREFDNADILLWKDIVKNEIGIEVKCYYYISRNHLICRECPAAWNIEELKKHLDNNFVTSELIPVPVFEARQMPLLEIGDWILLEGKTMRLLKKETKDSSEVDLRDKLKHLAKCKGVIAVETNIEGPILELYSEDFVPSDILDDSYGRLEGANIRHLERLTKLEILFLKFFKTEVISKTFHAGLFGQPYQYSQYLSVELNTKASVATQDLLDLGISLDQHEIPKNPTIENTIPFKKVLEILTCFDPIKYHECPWRVSLNIFKEQKSFLLSAGKSEHDTKQVIVSMPKPNTTEFVGSSYPYIMNYCLKNAQVVDDLLNKPLNKSQTWQTDSKEIIEMVVLTQVAESHATRGYLVESRVPGTGKQARAIIRDHINKKTRLYSSFVEKGEHTKVFPMIGPSGTGRTKTAVNDLVRPDGTAPCTDMSEDSEVEELSDSSGQGK